MPVQGPSAVLSRACCQPVLIDFHDLSPALSSPPESTVQAPVLSAVELACRRGERRLFAGLNLQLPARRLLWLRGDNGRGKTSLLRLLAGLATPDAGQVLLGGEPVRKAALRGLRPLYIGHANALKDDLSATEALQFIARLHGRSAETPQVHAALERLGVASRRDAAVRTLSQGQRRRVALARLALESEATPWILDEPYDALDVAGIAALDDLLAGHLARGGSIILTSHQPLSHLAGEAGEIRLTAKGIAAPADPSAPARDAGAATQGMPAAVQRAAGEAQA
jgi:heme exporter protein A